MSLFGDIGNLASGAFNTVTHWFDNPADDLLKTLDKGQASMNTAYKAATAPAPKPTPSTNAADDQKWAQMSAQLAALQNQLAAQPKLPNFDILGNYNRAKQNATSDVTPLYAQKLNNFLEKTSITRTQKTQQTDLAYEQSKIAKENTVADNQTSRVRTGEDLANVLADIGTKRSEFLTDEGSQFDEARRGLQEEVAAAGGTDTGLGQQEISKQLSDRNVSTGRQIQEFKNNEGAKKLLADRTLEDLATGDIRAGEKQTLTDKGTKIDFDAAMGELANEEKSFSLQNELDKALDIISRTQSYSQQGVSQFIASLAGQGYRPQDIALAKQVYM